MTFSQGDHADKDIKEYYDDKKLPPPPVHTNAFHVLWNNELMAVFFQDEGMNECFIDCPEMVNQWSTCGHVCMTQANYRWAEHYLSWIYSLSLFVLLLQQLQQLANLRSDE